MSVKRLAGRDAALRTEVSQGAPIAAPVILGVRVLALPAGGGDRAGSQALATLAGDGLSLGNLALRAGGVGRDRSAEATVVVERGCGAHAAVIVNQAVGVVGEHGDRTLGTSVQRRDVGAVRARIEDQG